MLHVPVTSFVDFVMATGPARLTKVTEIKALLADYEPYKDFYRDIREAIIADHRNGKGTYMDDVLAVCTSKKEQHYREAAMGFRTYRRKADSIRSIKTAAEWTHGDLTIDVNPELRVVTGGQTYLVKLYFKRAPLAQRRVDVVLDLMARSLGNASHSQPALLDTRRAKLYGAPKTKRNLEPLLRGEAAAFMEMWRSL